MTGQILNKIYEIYGKQLAALNSNVTGLLQENGSSIAPKLVLKKLGSSFEFRTEMVEITPEEKELKVILDATDLEVVLSNEVYAKTYIEKLFKEILPEYSKIINPNNLPLVGEYYIKLNLTLGDLSVGYDNLVLTLSSKLINKEEE